jgi:hypothetical protein
MTRTLEQLETEQRDIAKRQEELANEIKKLREPPPPVPIDPMFAPGQLWCYSHSGKCVTDSCEQRVVVEVDNAIYLVEFRSGYAQQDAKALLTSKVIANNVREITPGGSIYYYRGELKNFALIGVS